MTSATTPPRITTRDAPSYAAALNGNRAGYVPEWTAVEDTGTALHDAMARNLEIQGDGLNAMPLRLQLALLESIGASVLPAQPARAPLVFALLASASGDATVPAGTRVGAILPPPAPALDNKATAPPSTAPEFFTEQEIIAMRGTLAGVYSIDPLSDTYADHRSGAAGDFAVFDTRQPVPHRLYLGHDELFALNGTAEIELTFSFGAAAAKPARAIDESFAATVPDAGQRPLLLDWEYLSADGWLPLALIEDGTRRFTGDGKITLAKRCGPDSKNDVIAGLPSYWLRATVSDRMPAARITLAAAAADSDGLFAVDVESAIELLVGDVVTVDGTGRAGIRHIFGQSLRLDAALAGAEPGEFVALADALPPLRPEAADSAGGLPRVDVVRARVGLAQSGLEVDSALLDSFALDTSKDFFPFGEQPRPYATCYLACDSAFARTDARIEIVVTLSKIYPEYADGTATPPTMQAEYLSGGRWLALGSDHEYVDASQALTLATSDAQSTAIISFLSPMGWEESERNGEKHYWLRLRLVDGDYGQPLSITAQTDPNDPGQTVVSSAPSTLRPPIVARVAVNYVYYTNPMPLHYCVGENDFAFVDHSEEARWPRRPFAPFVPVSDRAPALHIGFTQRPPSALVSVLVAVIEPAAQGDPQPLVWDYWGSRGWSELSVRDTTSGLHTSGLIQFVGPPDAEPRDGLGGQLYRIRARLKSGLAGQQQVFRCGGLWLNAVWASHGQRAEREPLGTSSGNPDQVFSLPIARAADGIGIGARNLTASDVLTFSAALDTPLAGIPVQAGEIVEVREWAGRGDDWRTAVAAVDAADLRLELDPRDPTITTAAWVRWHAEPNFYRSTANERHYVVERATGVFRFPGRDGFVLPAGAPIVVSYVTGGGPAGNVPIGAIRELRSSAGFIESVSNPLAAQGGASAELLRAARDRGVQTTRHRDRAVSIEDYEWLARSASAQVARARALPLAGPDGTGSRGFVGILLVPHAVNDPRPIASRQLAETVLAYLGRRAPAGVAGGLRLVAPDYLPVGVRADLQPLTAEMAATVEARVRAALTRFLHPITGAADGYGWEFGRSPYLSDVAALIHAIEGVASIERLVLLAGQSIGGDSVPIESHQLVCTGEMQLKIIVPGVPYALA